MLLSRLCIHRMLCDYYSTLSGNYIHQNSFKITVESLKMICWTLRKNALFDINHYMYTITRTFLFSGFCPFFFIFLVMFFFLLGSFSYACEIGRLIDFHVKIYGVDKLLQSPLAMTLLCNTHSCIRSNLNH